MVSTRRSQHPPLSQRRILMELERTLFFLFFFFYIPFFRGSETQEKDQSEKEEDNVLLEYLFTIWESHRIVDHIRRRRLVDGGGPGLLVSPSHIFLTFFLRKTQKIPFRSRRRFA